MACEERPISQPDTTGEISTSNIPRYSTGVWVQDDWTVSPRLTLNLGVRYDVELNAFGNKPEVLPFLPANRPNDTNNVGPRVGFTFSLNDRTVLRGGYGVYFGTVTTNRRLFFYTKTETLSVRNDGRPDFASNPWNGPTPTVESVRARFCPVGSLATTCIRPEFVWGRSLYGPTYKMPWNHSTSIGVQRQLGSTIAVEADYVVANQRNAPYSLPINVSYNPATGVNYPFSDISRRPFPEWGYVALDVNGSRSNDHALQTAFTKRMSNRWQASATYTLSVVRDEGPLPLNITRDPKQWAPVPFETAPDMHAGYALSIGDQRHRAVFNGIWQLPYDFQLSGLYFYGSGARYGTNWGSGVDLRGFGGVNPNEFRLRPNGTIIPRNNFVGEPIHRVDMRFQKRFRLGGRAGIDSLAEIFNVFNHANYGSYTLQEVSRNYGLPSPNSHVAYAPRMLQLGFRLTF